MKWSQFKKQVAACLLIGMTVFGGKAAMAVSAGDVVSAGWNITGDVKKTVTIRAEVGQQFHFGYFFTANVYVGYGTVFASNGSDLKLSYKSSSPSVISVGKKTGAAKVKKTGTAKVTITYKKKQYVCQVQAVKKGTLGTNKKAVKNALAAAKKIAKYKNKKVTSSNLYTGIKLIDEYKTNIAKIKETIDMHGFVKKKKTYDLLLPDGMLVNNVIDSFDNYLGFHPIQNNFKIKSCDAEPGKSTFTITLKKAVTAKEIYLMRYKQIYDGNGSDYPYAPKNAKTATFYVNIQDEDDESYRGSYATIKQGSNVAVVTLTKNGKTVKLDKNEVYYGSINDSDAETANFDIDFSWMDD